ncbi:MAG: extracellular solute-binding protein [Chloroflexi bacterium]|nr:extracellular solute-binding protein [Chloroflexota bacterium]
MLKVILTLGITVLVLSTLSCAGPPSPTPVPKPTEPPAKPLATAPAAPPAAVAPTPAPKQPGADEQLKAELDKVYEAAKKEGELIIAGASFATSVGEDGLQVFMKRFPGIKATLLDMTGTAAASRILAEAQRGRTTIDASKSLVSAVQPMSERDLLMDLGLLKALVGNRRIVSEFNGRWAMLDNTVSGLAYNSRLVAKADLPKSWEDLLDPKWKNRIGVDSRGLGFIHLYLAWGEAKARDYMQRLAEQKPVRSESGTVTKNKLLSGEIALGVQAFSSVLEEVQKGAPVGVAPLSPSQATSSGLFVPKGIAHPNGARLFVSWLLSPEGAQVLHDHGAGLVDQSLDPGSPVVTKLGTVDVLVVDDTFDKAIQTGKYQAEIGKILAAIKD